ncbi:MAG: hypothetical protein K2R98_27345 [Gemmataceae bacterium]|nr:hypothetical protein [Gemmataceae bacterium]
MSANKKKKAQNRNRLRQKLLNRKRQRQGEVVGPANSVVIHDPPGQMKMSAALLGLVDPYLKDVTDEEDLRKMLLLGVIAWNLALLPASEREASINEFAKKAPGETKNDLHTVLDPLIARKLALYPDNQRHILNIDVTMQAAGPYVQVTSTLPGDLEEGSPLAQAADRAIAEAERAKKRNR